MRDLKVRLKKFKKTHCHLTIELFGDYCLCAPSHPMGGATFAVAAVAAVAVERAAENDDDDGDAIEAQEQTARIRAAMADPVQMARMLAALQS